ncbi:hypothetical protein YYC_00123 [Plasmodium yoelii 17X]|uniref:Acylphosphatase-like domain-containing protein n=3 Tax=Plasmodium yoelii TaxID=5861 RepID=A0A078K283_PLAYE|nr:conserved protein, unknown function [Plasmodium yoelii]ETB63289.1 hypothetical protein YYC_00123 [Plasmodium yoelii 17X]CDU15884.1 conserved Plasmodium protein, unknown function [Plasmodium yoelii]VTZ71479.1 conserved protein, unknown function [Plasmodium yoelii]|eukprot:XP_022811230.1 conserved protein, unknown function [Plasmodium yoelii]
MIPTPVSKKIRSRLSLSVQKKPHFLFRQNLLLEKKDKWEPKLRKGHPEFATQFDILNRQVTGFRKYKPPLVKKEEIKKNYDITNFHEVKSKFRFEINGIFEDGGSVFCDELYKTAKRMFLVGWIKCRRKFVMGHFQGDSYSISYMRHWFDIYSSEFNKIHNLKIFDENHGIPKFDYYNITIVKDYRSPAKKKMHLIQSQEYLKTKALFNLK